MCLFCSVFLLQLDATILRFHPHSAWKKILQVAFRSGAGIGSVKRCFPAGAPSRELGAWILSSLGASGVRCGAWARSAMPWERRLEYWPTLVRMRVSNWLPEQGVSVVGVIAETLTALNVATEFWGVVLTLTALKQKVKCPDAKRSHQRWQQGYRE